MIDEHDLKSLLRLLRGETPPEERRRSEARLEAEPELRAAGERLERRWAGLELPATTAPPGFSSAVMERIAGADPETPGWARWAAAAALAGGIALGVGIGGLPSGESPEEALAMPPTLAERYLAAMAELDEGVAE